MPTDFEQRSVTTLTALKQETFGTTVLSGAMPGGAVIELLPFTRDQIDNTQLMHLLAMWRQVNIAGFTKVFSVTPEGTRAWSRSQLIERPDRIAFLIRHPAGPLLGHVGLSSFDFTLQTCEIDNIVRGEASAAKGLMQAALTVLMDWTYRVLAPREIQLRTLSDNTRALALYHRLGFIPFALHPLARTEGEGFVEWVPAQLGARIDRFLLAMRHLR